MKLLEKLFGRKARPVPEETKPAPEEAKPAPAETKPAPEEAKPAGRLPYWMTPEYYHPWYEGFYLTQKVTFGARRPDEDPSICVVNEKRGIRRTLVGTDGRIQDFPGIVKEDFWASQVTDTVLTPRIYYRTSLEERECGWVMFWTIQPDGRYWEDEDGFGATNDPEIVLYTYVDMDGRFTGPFRIYQVGEQYYSLDRFEYARLKHRAEYLQKLKAWNLTTEYVQKPEELLFPRLRQNIHHDYYGFCDREEALAYWHHPVLSADLVEATEILLNAQKPIQELGDLACFNKIHDSITMFWLLTEDPRFRAVLDKHYNGELNRHTVAALG